MTITIHRGILKIGHRLFMPIYHGKTLLIEQKNIQILINGKTDKRAT